MDEIEQCGPVDGLAQMHVHAGVDTLLLLVREDLCSERDNGWIEWEQGQKPVFKTKIC